MVRSRWAMTRVADRILTIDDGCLVESQERRQRLRVARLNTALHNPNAKCSAWGRVAYLLREGEKIAGCHPLQSFGRSLSALGVLPAIHVTRFDPHERQK